METNYVRCTCKWCHPEVPLRPHMDNIVDIAKYVLECSGPFDSSDLIHTLALAVLDLSRKRET